MQRLVIPAALILTLGFAGQQMAAQSPAASTSKVTTTVLAGGCFWSMEKAFEELPGVVSVVSGFSGGTLKNPVYSQVVDGGTGHVESVQVTYDPLKVSYAKLLDHYWHHIDPTTKDRQFCDGGAQYQSVIFYRNDAERKLAEETKAVVARELNKPVATEIRPAAAFYAAGPEHQDYYRNHPAAYNAYRIGCGRDRALKEVWGK
ncbi:MAG: peptide-methionine (S)-S-oxide reductase MsrA [Pseudomonadota bacterium]